MAGVNDIIRPLTSEDRKTIRDLNKQSDVEKTFKKRLIAFQRECQLKFVPFCEACVRKDFDYKKKSILDLIMRNADLGVVEVKDSDLKIDINFVEYSDKYYKEVGENSVFQPIIIDGMRTTQEVRFKNYKCPRGHGISIQQSMIKK